jgi:hypothetical protein
MRIVVDIDGVVCTAAFNDGLPDYGSAKPIVKMVAKINDLYRSGHEIIMHTGRHWNLLAFTHEQLHGWGLLYHSLVMGKPPADVLIDDKCVLPQNFICSEVGDIVAKIDSDTRVYFDRNIS